MARHPSASLCAALKISYPDTQLVRKALDLAHEHSTPAFYNHVVRCSVFCCIVGPRCVGGEFDLEVSCIAAILHDLGLDVASGCPSGVISADKRFEVDSADAARAFLLREAPDWSAAKVQLVWDACALHTTASIARHKEAEVVAASLGISADFKGPDPGPGPGEDRTRVSREQWDAVVNEWPRDKMLDDIKDALCELCRKKPATTYDNLVGQYGERYLQAEGYSQEGRRGIDFMQRAPL